MKNRNTNAESDILVAIKNQHEILKNHITVLMNESSSDSEKQKHLQIFVPILKMHSNAEEATIYALMHMKAQSKEDEQRVVEAETEHALAKSLVRELEILDYESEWNAEISAKAKILAEMVDHHVEEEEDSFFKAVRINLNPEERATVAVQFLEECDRAAKGQEWSELMTPSIVTHRPREHTTQM